MEAVPLAAAAVMVKLGVFAPSVVSEKESVPVMLASSSSPDCEVSPPKEPASLSWLMVTLTVAVSVTPPDVTV